MAREQAFQGLVSQAVKAHRIQTILNLFLTHPTGTIRRLTSKSPTTNIIRRAATTPVVIRAHPWTADRPAAEDSASDIRGRGRPKRNPGPILQLWHS